MKPIYTTIIFLFLGLALSAQTFPNLIEEDTDGNIINLQQDYLDNGKPVLIHFFAAWNPWDQFFMDTMSMQNAYQEYGPNGTDQIMILAYEIDPASSDDDLVTGIQGIDVNWTELINYPILNPDDVSWALDTMNVAWMPSLILFCPDGTVYLENGFNGDSINVVFDFPHIVTEDLNYSNLLTVDGVTDVFENLCGTNISDENVSGNVYFNTDNCSSTDAVDLSNVMVTLDNGTDQYIRSTNQFGYYEAFLPNGTYDISFDYPSTLMSVCEEPGSVTIDDDINSGLDAIYTADILCPEIVLNLDPFIIRPCENNSYISFQACNYGTVLLETLVANLQFPVGSEILSISPSIAYSYNDGTGEFNFTCDSLDVLTCKTFQIAFHSPCTTEVGDTLCFNLETSVVGNNPDCSDYIQENDEACNEVIGSYDPNDKRGMTQGNGPDNYLDAGTEIEYMIRFQNTGNDTAFVVRIDDPLSQVFDHTTIEPISASHRYELNYSDGIASFNFPDILLVDSFKNEPESHGFIKFRITLKEDLAPGTAIQNYANIYFDGNDPIITNVYEYAITVPVNTVEWEQKQVSLYPNPAQEELFVSLNNQEDRDLLISVYDLQGKLLITQSMTGDSKKISIGHLNEGLYLIQLNDTQTKKLIGAKKFVKN